jgi:hypothetical protein
MCLLCTMLQAGRPPVRVPDEVDVFNLLNPSSRTTVLVSSQPLTEMSTHLRLGLPSSLFPSDFPTFPPISYKHSSSHPFVYPRNSSRSEASFECS